MPPTISHTFCQFLGFLVPPIGLGPTGGRVRGAPTPAGGLFLPLTAVKVGQSCCSQRLGGTGPEGRRAIRPDRLERLRMS